MNEKELYQQKAQAQLDEWKADIAMLKAKASWASAEAQITVINEIEMHEHRLEETQAKLTALAGESVEAWDAIVAGMVTAREVMKLAVHDAAAKFHA